MMHASVAVQHSRNLGSALSASFLNSDSENCTDNGIAEAATASRISKIGQYALTAEYCVSVSLS